MSARRLIALAIIVLEASLAGYFLGRWLFAGVAVVVAIAGATGRWQLPASRTRDLRLTVFLFVLVLAGWQLIGKQNSVASAALADGLGFALVQFFLTAQVYELFVRRERGISPLFVLYGGIVMTCAGDVPVNGIQQVVFNWSYLSAVLVFVTLVTAFWVAGRNVRPSAVKTRTPWIVSSATLVLSLAFGAAVSFTLKTNQEQLDTWFANLIPPYVDARSVGFPDRAFLHSIGNIKEHDTDSIALRVVSEPAPGYMKGLAYDVYSDARWTITVTPEAVQPQTKAPGAGSANDMHTFALRPDAVPGGIPLNVWPEVDTTGAFFITLDSVRLQAPFDSVMADGNGNVASRENTVRSAYIVEETTDALPPEPLADADRARYTFVPSNLDPAIPQLAGAIFADAVSVGDKVAAVTQYFRENYQYELGITVPSDVDPLSYFLLEKPPAHCEYFATGAAILLRLGGVPCRYVTGFVAVEQNSFGGYWVARNRDAHAWVEAYDESRGWFIVEATVAEGVPSEDAVAGPSRAAEMWDYAKFIAREIVAAYATGGIRGLARWIGDALARLGAYALSPVPAALIVLAVLVLAVRRFQRKRPTAKERPEAAYRVELRALLNEMDRQLQRQGIERAAHETVVRFASRVSQEIPDSEFATAAAHWYRTYARLRFGAPPTPEQLGDLRKILPDRPMAS